MDKELIEGLSNLSNSLDKISEALSKKGEAKSASVTALQMGNFDKQIKEISQSIIEVKKDTQKLLDQQDTILKILKKEKDSKIDNKKEEKVKNITQEPTPVKVSKDKKVEREEKDNTKKEKVKNITQEPTPVKVSKDKKVEREEKDKDGTKKEKVKNIPQEPTPVKVSKDKKVEKEEKDRDDGKVKKVSSGKSTTEEVSKKKEEKKPGFFGDMDTKKIKDGISTVLIIATGIIAIGLALKLVGKIDFLSVIGLALALPLIAIAFTKIAAAFSGQEVDDGKGKKIKTNKINFEIQSLLNEHYRKNINRFWYSIFTTTEYKKYINC
jgi:HPt (histidine-containing phosphotransfer) domain-containing protein